MAVVVAVPFILYLVRFCSSKSCTVIASSFLSALLLGGGETSLRTIPH